MSNEEFLSVLHEKYGIMTPGPFDQDWKFTAGDSEHTEEYIDFYNEYSLTSDQKSEMINMIIQGFDDLIAEGLDQDSLNRIWKRIRQILSAEKQLHYPTILYWSCIDRELDEDRFYASKFLRELL